MEKLWELVIAGLFGSGGVAVVITAWLSYKANKLSHNAKMKELGNREIELTLEVENVRRKIIPLEHHPIFKEIETIEFFFMHTFRLPDLGRTLVIRELCVTKFRVWRRVLRKYAQIAQQCTESCTLRDSDMCNKGENLMSQMLLEGMEAYVNAFKDIGRKDVFNEKQYDSDSIETMEMFLRIFNEWHESRVEVVRKASREIPRANMHNDCHSDYWDVFSVYMYALVQTKYDATFAMAHLNGEMTGRKFLGVVIGDRRS
jgi:hypothetical protein